MEYEIGDDPQGAPDFPDGDRDGGLRVTPVESPSPLFFDRHDDAREEDSAPLQMG